MTGLCTTNPLDLLSPLRFDLCAKYFYAKYRRASSDFPLELYAHHLKVWNNYSEYNNPNKQDLESFVTEFNKILISIEEEGFNPDISYLPTLEGQLLNGAHRTAASILYQKPVYCKESPIAEGQLDCSHAFLRDRHVNVPAGLQREYADTMALQYAKLKKNTFVVTLFPSAFGHEGSVERVLRNYSTIVYTSAIQLSDYGPFNYIRMLYEGEAWLGAWQNSFVGAQIKMKECFKFPQPTRIYLIETEDPSALVEAKRLIRQLYNIGNDSVHINDTHEETLRIATSVFNANSVNFLNNCNPRYFNNFHTYFTMLKKWAATNQVETDKLCVDASAVLSVYGLRECRDVDFLYLGDHIETNTHDFSCHNGETKYYPMHKDEVIVNPGHHFYYQGIKFATPEVIKTMKQVRCEEKDLKDIQLINTIGRKT